MEIFFYLGVSWRVLWRPVCFFSSHVCSWWAVCSLYFWYGLKGISSWNNLINSSYLLSFLPFLFSFWTGSLFTAFLVTAKLLLSSWVRLPGNWFKSESLFEKENRDELAHQMWCPCLKQVKDICDCFSSSFGHKLAASLWACRSGYNAFIIAVIGWGCALRCCYRSTISPDLSLSLMLLAASLFCLHAVFRF